MLIRVLDRKIYYNRICTWLIFGSFLTRLAGKSGFDREVKEGA